MRVFITGATGFVGRHVVGQIRTCGHDILSFTLEKDHNESNNKYIGWLYGDLGNIDESLKLAIRSFDPEVVIHLAWQGIPDYSEAISIINLNNSIRLLDFIAEETNCKKIIVAGSCFEYGKNKGVCKESDPIRLKSFFSWAKYSLYQYLLLKCNLKGLELIWFRIFYVYGPKQRSGSLVPTLVRALKEGKAPDIRLPLNQNDFIYVEDVAKAFNMAVNRHLSSGIYNIGSGASTKVIDICEIIERQLFGNSNITNFLRKNVNSEQKVNFWADTSKSRAVLGWKYETTIEEGIKKYNVSEGEQ